MTRSVTYQDHLTTDRHRAAAARARLDSIARILDSRWRVPGTNIRFGADPVLNLIPGVGTLVAQGLSAYLIYEAHRHGASGGVLVRMVGNVAVDFVLSAVPVVGWVGDLFYRSNQRNMDLLRRHLVERI
jgi:hypothetical protein